MSKNPKIERTLALADSSATLALGAALARSLRAGDVVFLQGDLGAGKTTLARGLIRALTGETNISSPTYNIVQIYPTPAFDIWHIDLYRLKAPEEALELGLEDAFQSAVCLVEWPERLQDGFVSPGLRVRLSPEGAEGRIAVLQAAPEWEDRIVAI